MGSPPPMRGKGWTFQRLRGRCRITPAYAGKRPFSGATLPACQDHPRLCGEKVRPKMFSLQFKGSPPPMRGKGTGSRRRHKKQRITPAYAGKSGQFVHQMHCLRDHPRLCGEKVVPSVIHSSSTGSPPPMRGKVAERSDCLSVIGITPAYAGKSPSEVCRPR